MMGAPEPVDELEMTAHMPDAEAVRRSFDSRNALMTAIYATIFAAVDFGSLTYGLASSRPPRLSWLVAAAGLVISAAMAWAMIQLARWKPGRTVHPAAVHVSRNLSDWIVGYLLIQFAAFSYIGGPQGAAVWGSLIPWLIIGLRTSLPRRLAVHLALFAITLAMALLYAPSSGDHSLVAIGITHAVAFGFGSLNSRRVRRQTIASWTERRASAREQLRMRDELRYARELQLSMLPEEPPHLDWADIAGTSIPATEVGGDYFDYIEVDDCLAVICGDVAGHGLSSGITLSALRGGITLLRRSLTTPATVLERLHEVVAQNSRRRTLVTLAAALFDPKRRCATIASAGHPPVLVRHPSGHVDTIELFSQPLGVRRTEPVPQREVPFEPGDVFVMHSDGIYEATNEAGEPFGLDRLTRVLAAAEGSAAETRDAVLRSVEQFRGSEPQHDDVTIVVVSVRA